MFTISFILYWLVNTSKTKEDLLKEFYLKLSLFLNYFWSCFFFFLIVDLYFLVLTVIAQIVNPFAELVIPIGIQTKEEKGKMETHPVIVQGNIRKC